MIERDTNKGVQIRAFQVYQYVIARVGENIIPEISQLTVLLKINNVASQ